MFPPQLQAFFSQTHSTCILMINVIFNTSGQHSRIYTTHSDWLSTCSSEPRCHRPSEPMQQVYPRDISNPKGLLLILMDIYIHTPSQKHCLAHDWLLVSKRFSFSEVNTNSILYASLGGANVKSWNKFTTASSYPISKRHICNAGSFYCPRHIQLVQEGSESCLNAASGHNAKQRRWSLHITSKKATSLKWLMLTGQG